MQKLTAYFSLLLLIITVMNLSGCGGGGETSPVPPTPGACGDPSTFQWEDAISYYVMVDRFSDGDGISSPVPNVETPAQYQGGDWVGLESKVQDGYLQDLGINTLWLSPPYDNREGIGVIDGRNYSAYHGFWPSPANIDYSEPDAPAPRPAVESRFGDENALSHLIEATHAKDMQVMFDYEPVHVDIDSGLYAAHPDWFSSHTNGTIVLCAPDKWDDPYWGTRCALADFLPHFDFYNTTVRQWSIDDAIWWAKTFAIDGYGIDLFTLIPPDWSIDLRTALDAQITNPTGVRFYVVGEAYTEDPVPLINATDPTSKLDGTIDYPLRKRLCEALFSRAIGLDALFDFMDNNDTAYATGTVMSTTLGTAFTPRAIHYASGQLTDCSATADGWTPEAFTQPLTPEPYERLGLAFGILMTKRGAPLIYYGDEIGLAGGGDPDNRRFMQFNNLNQYQQGLRAQVRNLAAIRNGHIALRRGSRVVLTKTTDTVAYKMTGCGDSEDVYVLLNRADSPVTISGLPAGTYTELLSGTVVNGGANIVAARTLMILTANN
jgi:glycosidase